MCHDQPIDHLLTLAFGVSEGSRPLETEMKNERTGNKLFLASPPNGRLPDW